MKLFGIQIGRVKPLELKVTPTVPPLPVSGGRSSVSEGDLSLSSFFQNLTQADPNFRFEFLKALQHLAIYNADLSYAVENVVQLGSTTFDIFFPDNIPQKQQDEMREYLSQRMKALYHSESGLVADLLTQTIITGTLSAEIVPADNLKSVKKIVLVDPYNIRFLYNKENDSWDAHQVSTKLSPTTFNLNRLNPITYKYIPVRLMGENPYGIPPFLSALESLLIEKDMMCNVQNIVKKLGVLGFLNVLLTEPSRKPNETEQAYYSRLQSYLSSQALEVDKGMAKGYAIGFKDRHSFTLEGAPSNNATGAAALIEMNDTRKIAGLKQDPMMLGRNFNTTEALGRVVLTKLGKQIATYQNPVAAFLKQYCLMELLLGGYRVYDLTVDFERPMLADELKEEETREKKINNARQLLQDGIISQNQYARELGYDAPYQDQPIDTSADDQEDIQNSFFQLGGDAPVLFEEEDFCGCTHTHSFGLSDEDKQLELFFKQYLDATDEAYRDAVNKVAAKISQSLSQLGNGATEGQVVDRVIATLYKSWSTSFAGHKKIVSKFVSEIYRFFRSSATLFESNPEKAVKAVFGARDFRTMAYYSKSDSFYLGKFITDPKLKSDLSAWIKEKYLNQQLPIGDFAANKELIAEFKKQFAGTLEKLGEKHIQLIIDTTVNKLRNYASVQYMHQAQVTEFEIRGVNDSLQCAWCAQMQGKRFSVVKALDQIDALVSSEPSFVKQTTPFINSVYKKPEQLEGLTGADIQNAGIALPAYHPRCRDVIVAVL